MKKILFRLLLVASITAITACAKVEEDLVSSKNDDETCVEITVTADSKADLETRTAAVDGANPYVKWLSTDDIEVYEIVDDAVFGHTSSTTTTLSGTNDESASFKATLTGSPSGSSYKYSAVYPAEAVGYNSQSEFYYLIMPDTQTLVGSNFSEDSDLLISGVLDHSTTRVVSSESLSFSFRRVGTIVRLKLSGITANEKIKKVILTAPVNVAGRLKFNPETGQINTEAGIYYGATKTITLNVDDITATGTDYLWFRVISVDDWAKDSELAIEVETDAANYYRNGKDVSHAKITLPKTFEFEEGGLTAFGVSLGSYRVAKPMVTNYTKVTESSQIQDGGEYLIVGDDSGDKYAMGAYDSTKNIYGQTSVEEDNNVIGISSETVQIITLEAGETSGQYYLIDSGNQYLYHDGTSNNVIYVDDTKGDTNDYLWTVTTSRITNVGTNTRFLQYNSANDRFACYLAKSNQADVTLYVNTSSLLPVGISFDEDEFELIKGTSAYSSFAGQAVTKSGGEGDTRSVTYAIAADDDDIISDINTSTGAITLSGEVGTAKISATVGKTAGTYRAGTITYNITVVTPTLSGTAVVFTDPTADVESSTLTPGYLTNVTYSYTDKPDWIDEVVFDDENNTMEVTSKDNKTLSSRNGTITVKATGDEGNVSAEISVSQVASVFSASSTTDVIFAWDDYTNVEIKRVTITSSYPINDEDNLELDGTDAAAFEATLTRNGSTNEYYLDINVVDDNDSGDNYVATVTVSRDENDIVINLMQLDQGSVCYAPTFSSASGATLASTATVNISSETEGSTIYYTTNGSDPTTSSSHGTEGAHVANSVSVAPVMKAMAYKAGVYSDITTVYYNITATKSSFDSTSGNILASFITYSTAKNGGTANTKTTNNMILCYQPGSGQTNGGSITVSAASGYEIMSVSFKEGNQNATTVAYKIDGGSASSNQSLSKNGTLTKNNLTASSFELICRGSSSSYRLYVSEISVTFRKKQN